MDKRIFDMLELYKQNNIYNQAKPVIKPNFEEKFCKETDYSAPNPEVLTMAFVNMQPIDRVYDTTEGFPKGTIFPNIDKPFYGGKMYE